MKKLLIALLSIAAVVAVSDANAFGRCGRSCRAKSCEPVLNCNRAPRVCKTVHTEGDCPTEKCVRTVEVDAPCDVTKYVHTTYSVECPNDGNAWTKVPRDYVCAH
jgi:hypothetical protein